MYTDLKIEEAYRMHDLVFEHHKDIKENEIFISDDKKLIATKTQIKNCTIYSKLYDESDYIVNTLSMGICPNKPFSTLSYSFIMDAAGNYKIPNMMHVSCNTSTLFVLSHILFDKLVEYTRRR